MKKNWNEIKLWRYGDGQTDMVVDGKFTSPSQTDIGLALGAVNAAIGDGTAKMRPFMLPQVVGWVATRISKKKEEPVPNKDLRKRLAGAVYCAADRLLYRWGEEVTDNNWHSIRRVNDCYGPGVEIQWVIGQWIRVAAWPPQPANLTLPDLERAARVCEQIQEYKEGTETRDRIEQTIRNLGKI